MVVEFGTRIAPCTAVTTATLHCPHRPGARRRVAEMRRTGRRGHRRTSCGRSRAPSQGRMVYRTTVEGRWLDIFRRKWQIEIQKLRAISYERVGPRFLIQFPRPVPATDGRRRRATRWKPQARSHPRSRQAQGWTYRRHRHERRAHDLGCGLVAMPGASSGFVFAVV